MAEGETPTGPGVIEIGPKPCLEGDTEMAVSNLAEQLMAQGMGQLSGSAVVAQNNFITVNKALDYDFMEQRRMITLEEGVGVREVASKSVPAGPSSGA